MESDIVLREIELEDYDNYYHLRAEPSNLYWTGYENPPEYHNFKSWFIDRLSDRDRCIYLAYQKNNCLGYINIDYYSSHAAIGYAVNSKFQGKGIASELVKKSKRIIKQRENINAIIAWVNEHNAASCKVLEKNDFSVAGSEHRMRFGKSEVYYKYNYNL